MLRRFLAALCLVLAVGGVFGYLGLHQYLMARQSRQEEAATNLRKDIQVTVVEGKRREEIAALMAAKGICGYGDFMAASQGHEGSLFPDTYRFFPNSPASQVVATMLQNYRTRTAGLGLSQDQLILASIVEREGGDADQRAQVAGVYGNRLRIGMRLDADPTVQYAKDSQAYAASADPAHYVFWSEITQYDYSNVQSDYNTHMNAGLPPGPIANPGLASIKAAMNPAQNSDYYFIFKNGKLLLAQTLAQHEANAQ